MKSKITKSHIIDPLKSHSYKNISKINNKINIINYLITIKIRIRIKWVNLYFLFNLLLMDPIYYNNLNNIYNSYQKPQSFYKLIDLNMQIHVFSSQ